MPRKVSATEARVQFGELIRSVVEDGDTVVVERAGGRQVVVISMEEYARLKARAHEDPRWAAFRAAQAVAAEIQAGLAGRAIPAPEDVVAQGREARDAEVDSALDRRP